MNLSAVSSRNVFLTDLFEKKTRQVLVRIGLEHVAHKGVFHVERSALNDAYLFSMSYRDMRVVFAVTGKQIVMSHRNEFDEITAMLEEYTMRAAQRLDHQRVFSGPLAPMWTVW